MVEDSLVCYDIEEEVAIRDYWCVSYRPEDPICNAYATCLDQTEQRSIACTEPNTSGIVNQARYYTCNTSSWSDWVDTSSACTPDPATCIEAVETRSVACEAGYEGLISEQQLTTCSTPYSTPMISDWITISNSCTLSATDPVSPTSVTNPASPVSDMITTVPDPLPEVTGNTSTTTQPMNDPVEMENAMPEETATESTQEKQEQEESKPEVKAPEVEENQEIVPGFGVVLMMKTLDQLNDAYQQPLDDYIGPVQDDYAAEQNLLLNLIQSDDIGDRFDSIARHRWDQLHGDNPLQRYGFGD